MYTNVLPDDLISQILDAPEVTTGLRTMTGRVKSFYLTSHVTAIKAHLNTSFGLSLSGDTLPMRWIKGDTLPHIDTAGDKRSYIATYLVYLTGSSGEFIVDSRSYPISRGAGYSFPAGTSHGALGTGEDDLPRLLLGPMNENGIPVGGSPPNSVTTTGTITIRTAVGIFPTRYKIGDGEWQSCRVPLAVTNEVPAGNPLIVLFDEGVTFTSLDQYLVCGSNNIQFGSKSSMSVITVSGITGYQGLIENGLHSPGFDIFVYNIKVVSEGSTLSVDSGWIGQVGFSRSSTSYMVNCHSTGPIAAFCGGIIGTGAGNHGGSPFLIGCSSSGTIADSAGGIVGAYAGDVSCTGCWSTGTVAGFAGGIFGAYSGRIADRVSGAYNCYSTGALAAGAGGIFGTNAGNWIAPNTGRSEAERCYRRGVTAGAGGIFAGLVKNATMTNCYCTGTTALYLSSEPGTTIESVSYNNYGAASWNTVNAAAALTGEPDVNGLGTTWLNLVDGEPFILRHMGYSPYTSDIVNTDTGEPIVINSYGETTVGGVPTTAGSVGSYQILYTSEPSIDTVSSSGQFNTDTSTPLGDHILIVLKGVDNGGYSTTDVYLTINFQLAGNDEVHLRHDLEEIEYSYDGTSWNNVIFPAAVNNTGPGTFKVIFDSDITLLSTVSYFIPLTGSIQFGSTSLNTDGTRPTITVEAVTDYPGLISNGTVDTSGTSYINVFNLVISTTGGSTLAQYGGWFGQRYYSKEAIHNYFVNCHSNGVISAYGGGIVGADSGSKGLVTMLGCSSSGGIEQEGGGIAGSTNHNTICNKCWSTGEIIASAGGILGSDARVIAEINLETSLFPLHKVFCCYSTGLMGADAGGIVGLLNSDIIMSVAKCYSRGTGGNGIGSHIAVYNSYCLSATIGDVPLVSSGNYVAGSNWSDTSARAALSGAPASGSLVGTHWVGTTAGQPYELRNMGYSPYVLQNIDTNGPPSLVTSESVTAYLGGPSVNTIRTDQTHQILRIIPSTSTIAFNQFTGRFTVRPGTTMGAYQVVMRSTGSYNVSSLVLTVQDDPTVPCLLHGTQVLTPSGYRRVEDLRRGDYVLTDGRSIRIENIYISRVRGNKSNCPAIIARGSISPAYPPKDFRISQAHMIKYGSNWVNPGYYPIDTSYIGKEIVYYHLRLPEYSHDHLVIEDGVTVESLGCSTEDFIEYEKRIRASISFHHSV